MSEALPKRSELPKEQQWSIETVFANEAEWEKAFQEVSASLDELKPFAGRLGESAQTLLQALQKRDRLNLAAQKVGLYASLNLSTDGANPTYAAMNAQASSLIAQVNAAAAFIVPEILRIEPAKLEQFMAQEPELAMYRHHLERLQLRRDHIRSVEVEEVMARSATPWLASVQQRQPPPTPIWSFARSSLMGCACRSRTPPSAAYWSMRVRWCAGWPGSTMLMGTWRSRTPWPLPSKAA